METAGRPSLRGWDLRRSVDALRAAGGWLRGHRRSLVSTLVMVAHMLGFLSSISALMSTRTSQGAIAWIVSLNTFPYIAVPAYWVLGRSEFQGYVIARRDEDSELRRALEGKSPEIQRFKASLPAEHGRVRALERLAELPFLGGNDAELLIDGEATFDSIFAGIEAAERYVLVQFFIVKDDELGRDLKERLIRKASQGVRVYFLYDEIGSHKLPRSYQDELRSAGVRVNRFHTTRGAGNRFQINFRNHRKVVVVDGERGWVGGHNVGQEYLDGGADFDAWRDTHLEIEGPAVLGLQLSFVEDWHWATDEVPELSWTPVASSDADLAVLVLPSGPADSRETASLAFQHAIHSAARRVWIASPYFVPDEGVMAALQLAELRGVEVRVLIPDDPDHLLVYLSGYAFIGRMLDAGIEIHRYQAGFLHQKVLLVDDIVAAVGTANLDNRSFRLNFEITAIVVDEGFAHEVEAMLLDDFARARRMTRQEIDAKPWWFRVASRAAYLTAPIL